MTFLEEYVAIVVLDRRTLNDKVIICSRYDRGITASVLSLSTKYTASLAEVATSSLFSAPSVRMRSSLSFITFTARTLFRDILKVQTPVLSMLSMYSEGKPLLV